jgi:hypothetical protein
MTTNKKTDDPKQTDHRLLTNQLTKRNPTLC